MLRDEFHCFENALTEVDAKSVLGRYDIHVPRGRLVAGVADVKAALRGLAPPFVVKLVSPDVLHKSDVGGVQVNVRTSEEVCEAVTTMAASPKIRDVSIFGWLIEEMSPPGRELVVGGFMDEAFGPLIMVGLGGVFVELLADVSFRICPIAPIDALEMLEELRAYGVLNGARGGNPISREAIVDILMKIGGPQGLLVSHCDEILEVDLNPVIVSEHAAIAVDARILLAPIKALQPIIE